MSDASRKSYSARLHGRPQDIAARRKAKLVESCRKECEPIIQLKADILRQHLTYKIIANSLPVTPEGVGAIARGEARIFDIIEEIRNPAARQMVDRLDQTISEIVQKWQDIAMRELMGYEGDLTPGTAILPKRGVTVTSAEIYRMAEG